MRTNVSIELALSAALMLVGCDSTTAPELPPPDVAMVPVLTVVPRAATVDGGNSIRLTATLSATNPQTRTPPQVAWISSDTNVATIRPDGLVEGRKAGRAQIVATWQAARGSALITVRSPVKKKSDQPACLERMPNPEPAHSPSGKC
jgi:hypothetical protein